MAAIPLSSLKPKWWNASGSGETQGITFQCPLHRSHRLAIKFGYAWERHGDTFPTLTVTPSIDASRQDGCPHFFITNGFVDIVEMPPLAPGEVPETPAP
jgi:hypothetical protein